MTTWLIFAGILLVAVVLSLVPSRGERADEPGPEFGGLGYGSLAMLACIIPAIILFLGMALVLGLVLKNFG